MTEPLPHLRPMVPHYDPPDMVRWDSSKKHPENHSLVMLEQHSEDVTHLYPRRCYGDTQSRGRFRAVTSNLEVWKKTFADVAELGSSYHWVQVLVRLCIPVGAIVYCSNSSGYFTNASRVDSAHFKMRASLATVLDQRLLHPITGVGDPVWIRESFSSHNNAFKYRNGALLEPENGFYEGFETCERGIHFFMRPVHAELYSL